MKPQTFIALTRPFMDCVETLEEASLATIKRIASYSPSSVPYCLTYCQGVSCLQKICVGTRETSHAQDSITDERTTLSLLQQLLAPVLEVTQMAGAAQQSVSDCESSTSSAEEKTIEDVSSEDSVDEFMKTMADDIFMDHEELERRNQAASLRHPKRSHRRRPRKKQLAKKPTWRAQNFRSRRLQCGVTRRSDSPDEGRVRAAAEGESHQHQQQRMR